MLSPDRTVAERERDELMIENHELREALEETIDLCNSLREYAPTLNLAAERRLRDSLRLIGRYA